MWHKKTTHVKWSALHGSCVHVTSLCVPGIDPWASQGHTPGITRGWNGLLAPGFNNPMMQHCASSSWQTFDVPFGQKKLEWNLAQAMTDQYRFLGMYPTHPSLRPYPNPAPTQTLDLTQGRGGMSPETWIDPQWIGADFRSTAKKGHRALRGDVTVDWTRMCHGSVTDSWKMGLTFPFLIFVPNYVMKMSANKGISHL